MGRQVLFGAAAWIVFAALRVRDLRHDAWGHALLLLAALVLVPLVLDLVGERNDDRRAAAWLGRARRFHFAAAVGLLASCLLPTGALAGALALPWLGFTGMLAYVGAVRMARHRFARPLDRLVTDAALLFTFIGGLWTSTDRFGVAPLRFDALIVTLTAVHFHYAGLLLPLFSGLVARRTPESRFVARILVAIILGVPAVAIGITATYYGWNPAIEAAAGSALALAGICVGVLHVRASFDRALPAAARALLAVAGISLVAGMVLAGLYAGRHYAPVPWLGIPQMRALHGTLNAIGFGLCGALAWRRALPSRTDGASRL